MPTACPRLGYHFLASASGRSPSGRTASSGGGSDSTGWSRAHRAPVNRDRRRCGGQQQQQQQPAGNAAGDDQNLSECHAALISFQRHCRPRRHLSFNSRTRSTRPHTLNSTPPLTSTAVFVQSRRRFFLHPLLCVLSINLNPKSVRHSGRSAFRIAPDIPHRIPQYAFYPPLCINFPHFSFRILHYALHNSASYQQPCRRRSRIDERRPKPLRPLHLHFTILLLAKIPHTSLRTT